MNYTIIILGVVVVVLLYILYKYLLSPATSLAAQAYLKTKTPAQLKMPASSSSRNYSYNIWVCVNSWPVTSQYSTIFFRPTAAQTVDVAYPGSVSATTPIVLSSGNPASTDPQIALFLDKTTPTLYCYIQQTTGGAKYVGAIPLTTNFPIQSWVYVSISVQGNYVDLYLQGKLVKSIQLTVTPTAPGDDTVPTLLGGSIDANVAAFQYYPNALTPQQVWSNYMAGNGQNSVSSLTSYGVNVDLTSNGAVQNTYTLF